MPREIITLQVGQCGNQSMQPCAAIMKSIFSDGIRRSWLRILEATVRRAWNNPSEYLDHRFIQSNQDGLKAAETIGLV